MTETPALVVTACPPGRRSVSRPSLSPMGHLRAALWERSGSYHQCHRAYQTGLEDIDADLAFLLLNLVSGM